MCVQRRICPSPGVRDELTAQLLFQLHGLFENNVMSFITDNPRKRLLWQPGKRMALTSQSEVPVVPSVSTNSLSSLGVPPTLCLGRSFGRRRKREGQTGGGLTLQKARGQMRKLRPKEKRDSRHWLILSSASRAEAVWGPRDFFGAGEEWISGCFLHSLFSQTAERNSLRSLDKNVSVPLHHLTCHGKEEKSCQEPPLGQ